MYECLLEFSVTERESRDEVEKRYRPILALSGEEFLPFGGTKDYPLEFMEGECLLYNFRVRDCIGIGIWTFGPGVGPGGIDDFDHKRYVLWCS